MSHQDNPDCTAPIDKADTGRMPTCPYCGQPDVMWGAEDLKRGQRDGTGYVEFHCYAAKALR
jgi:hypothetical protein